MSTSSHITTYDPTMAGASSGKPSMTMIRAPQQPNWHSPAPQQTYIMAQKPTGGKPLTNLPQQQPSGQLSAMINRVKQEPPMDEQQRSDLADQNKQQPMFSPLISKAPANRMPTSTYIQPQQQWYSPNTPQQFNPPPSYPAATRARYPSVMPQAAQNQPSPQTLIAPLRPNSSTPPPTYMPRTSSAPNLLRAPSIRPPQFSSQQQQQQPSSQDPSIR